MLINSLSRCYFGKGRLLFLLCLLLCGTAQTEDNLLFRSLTPDTASLDTYRWKKRPVIIFSPSEKDAQYIEQIRILKQRQSALDERDILVLTDTSPGTRGLLRSQLQPESFEIVLVGKDGGIKLRETTPITAEALLSTIDKMPMRKAGQD